jgi:hypothetical protein
MLTLLRFPRIAGWEVGVVIGTEFSDTAAVTIAVPVHAADIPWSPPFRGDTAEAWLGPS